MAENYEDRLTYRIVVQQSDLDAITASVASASARGMAMGAGAAPTGGTVRGGFGATGTASASPSPGGSATASGGAPGGPATNPGAPGSPISQKTISNLVAPLLRSTFPGIFGYRSIGGHILTQAQRGAFGNIGQKIGNVKGIGGFMKGMSGTGGNISSALLRSGIPGGAGLGQMISKVGVGAIAGSAVAAVASLKMLKDAIGKATEGFHQIAGSLVGGDASKAVHGMINVMQGAAKGIGGVVAGVGAAIMLINPPVGALIAAIGVVGGYVGEKVIGVLHSFVDAMDDMVEQLGKWSPIVSAQNAMLKAQTMMFNIQMAQVFQPMMSAWIEIKSAVLDVLLEFGKDMAPLIKDFGSAMHEMVPYIKVGLALLVVTLANAVAAIMDLVAIIIPTPGNIGRAIKANAFAAKVDASAAVIAAKAFLGDNSEKKPGPAIFAPIIPVPLTHGIQHHVGGGFGGFHQKLQPFQNWPNHAKPQIHRDQRNNKGAGLPEIPPLPHPSFPLDFGAAEHPHQSIRDGSDQTGMLFNSTDRERIASLLDSETAKIQEEFSGWRHETNRAACLSGMVNQVGIYL